IEDIEQTVLTNFAEADGDTARRQKAIRSAIGRLRLDGVLDEESEGRYRISPLVEVVLHSDRLSELQRWLKVQSTSSQPINLYDGPATAGDHVDSDDDDIPGAAL
ncbi:MAG: DUF4194 domain-containing protein, partial [Cryobacterium sp.]|nr:DUF4194 domain-containing protein [Cryobacterium sp.]